MMMDPPPPLLLYHHQEDSMVFLLFLEKSARDVNESRSKKTHTQRRPSGYTDVSITVIMMITSVLDGAHDKGKSAEGAIPGKDDDDDAQGGEDDRPAAWVYRSPPLPSKPFLLCRHACC